MLKEFFTDHGVELFPIVVLFLVLLAIRSSKKKVRKERPDPPLIYGPIRGMYVCYQCDTVFNTPRCPECLEEAVIPLIHLTGSLTEDERVAAVIGKLQGHTTSKLPRFQIVPLPAASSSASASGSKGSNGSASEFPAIITTVTSERSSELS